MNNIERALSGITGEEAAPADPTEEAVRERALAPSLGVTDSEVRIRRNQILDVINARYRGDNREIHQDAIDCEVLWRLARTELALEALTVAHAARLDLLEEVLADVRREAKGLARREGR